MLLARHLAPLRLAGGRCLGLGLQRKEDWIPGLFRGNEKVYLGCKLRMRRPADTQRAWGSLVETHAAAVRRQHAATRRASCMQGQVRAARQLTFKCILYLSATRCRSWPGRSGQATIRSCRVGSGRRDIGRMESLALMGCRASVVDISARLRGPWVAAGVHGVQHSGLNGAKHGRASRSTAWRSTARCSAKRSAAQRPPARGCWAPRAPSPRLAQSWARPGSGPGSRHPRQTTAPARPPPCFWHRCSCQAGGGVRQGRARLGGGVGWRVGARVQTRDGQGDGPKRWACIR